MPIPASGSIEWPPWAQPATIQPGARLEVGGTLGFIFESRDERGPGGKPVLYASTHGHGGSDWGEVGDVLRLMNGPTIGVVVAKNNNNWDDWRLVRVFEESRDFVDFEVRHWTGPTGPPVAEAVELGDVVCLYGWGNVAQLTSALRPRCGRLTAASTAPYSGGVTGFHYFLHVTDNGASGSPVIHHKTGRALGMHLGSSYAGEGRAIDMCSLLDRFASAGYDLRLGVAPYHPPKPTVVPVAPYTHPALQDGPSPLWWRFDSECLAGPSA